MVETNFLSIGVNVYIYILLQEAGINLKAMNMGWRHQYELMFSLIQR